MRQEVGHRGVGHADVPAQQGGHQFAAAVVGDVGHVGVGEMLHKLHVEKSLCCERAGAAEAVLVRGGLGFFHKVGK